MRRHTWWLVVAGLALIVQGGPVVSESGDLPIGGDPVEELNMPGELPDGIGAHDCNPQHVLCDAIEPVCFRAGTVPSVVDGCWGECVDLVSCQPVACGGDSQCPQQTSCQESGFCATEQPECALLIPGGCNLEPWSLVWLLSFGR